MGFPGGVVLQARRCMDVQKWRDGCAACRKSSWTMAGCCPIEPSICVMGPALAYPASHHAPTDPHSTCTCSQRRSPP